MDQRLLLILNGQQNQPDFAAPAVSETIIAMRTGVFFSLVFFTTVLGEEAVGFCSVQLLPRPSFTFLHSLHMIYIPHALFFFDALSFSMCSKHTESESITWHLIARRFSYDLFIAPVSPNLVPAAVSSLWAVSYCMFLLNLDKSLSNKRKHTVSSNTKIAGHFSFLVVLCEIISRVDRFCLFFCSTLQGHPRKNRSVFVPTML